MFGPGPSPCRLSRTRERGTRIRSVATETGRFIEWLEECGHVTSKAAKEGAALAAEAAEVLPRAEEGGAAVASVARRRTA